MPVKNAGKYLKPCLDSIVNQTYAYWELIAINDGSTDGSEQVLRNYAARYPNITTANSSGTGIIKAMQSAYKLAKGSVIHRMDADDLMPPNKLSLMVSALKPYSVVTGKVSYFCDEHEVGDGFQKYTTWLNGLMDGDDFWRDVYRECPMPSSAWMMHRADFEQIGGFQSTLMPEDYDLAFRVLKSDLAVIRLKDIIHHWRDSATRTSRNESLYFPIAYLPLKVHYFLELHYNTSKTLTLWGAGKKGKLVAKQLIKRDISFNWVTNNHQKIGKDIYGVILKSDKNLKYKATQMILALSSPDEQIALQTDLDRNELLHIKDYFWFF
jgi:glycosyltransferase involved in cell wall biosynthesis